jgi:hypothetical protein
MAIKQSTYKRVERPDAPAIPEHLIAQTPLIDFRTDLRTPESVFGRCAFTGQWTKCVTIDLGDISVEAPDTTKGVHLDAAGVVTFDFWKPVIFNNQLTVSEDGLKAALKFLQDAENPIPGLSPVLVYGWYVMYTDGSAKKQFEYDPNTGQEVESHTGDLNLERIKEISLVPRHNEDELPTYTFVKETGKFFKSGVELDLGYDGKYIAESTVINARRVQATWGSTVNPSGLSRRIDMAHSNVLYMLGWKVGGMDGAKEDAACVIGIDGKGRWRPYEYTEAD